MTTITSPKIEWRLRQHIGKFVDLYYIVNGRTIFARGIVKDIEGHVLYLTSDAWGDYYLDLRSVTVFTARFCDPEDADRLMRKPVTDMEYKEGV